MDSKQIQEITAEGILYTDNDNNKKFIAFEDCFNTFLKWEFSVPIITQKKAELIRAVKQVGEIDYIGEKLEPWITESTNVNQPYVLFYDDKLTTFEFAEQNECAEFHKKVTQSGWNLFDRSD